MKKNIRDLNSRLTCEIFLSFPKWVKNIMGILNLFIRSPNTSRHYEGSLFLHPEDSSGILRHGDKSQGSLAQCCPPSLITQLEERRWEDAWRTRQMPFPKSSYANVMSQSGTGTCFVDGLQGLAWLTVSHSCSLHLSLKKIQFSQCVKKIFERNT